MALSVEASCTASARGSQWGQGGAGQWRRGGEVGVLTAGLLCALEDYSRGARAPAPPLGELWTAGAFL